MSQMALPLAWPADPRDDEFLLSPSNAAAAERLGSWREWPVMTALLTGPRKSGRSLLARIFAARSGGAVIDDADLRAEVEVFHAWNCAQEERRPLLLVANAAPPAWRVALPDLRSRLSASPLATIAPPDDMLMRSLFQRQFDRRAVDARPELVDWLLPRIERSYLAVLRTVDVLDQETLRTRKRLSIPLARNALAAASLIASADRPSPEPA